MLKSLTSPASVFYRGHMIVGRLPLVHLHTLKPYGRKWGSAWTYRGWVWVLSEAASCKRYDGVKNNEQSSHAYTHKYTHRCTHRHTHAHAHVETYIRTHTYIHTHSHMHTPTLTQIHTTHAAFCVTRAYYWALWITILVSTVLTTSLDVALRFCLELLNTLILRNEQEECVCR